MSRRVRISLIVTGCAFLIVSAGLLYAHQINSLEKAAAVQGFLSEYSQANEVQERDIAKAYSSKISYEDMLDILETRYPLCHVEAHPLGRAIYSQTQNLQESLRQCKTRCSDGCFHGVLMEMFSSKSDTLGNAFDAEANSSKVLEEIESKAHELCFSSVAGFIQPWTCLHALGHVFAYVTKYDIEKSISACKSLKEKYASRLCASGVFMEYLSSPEKLALITRKDYFPCDKYPEYSGGCFRYKVGYMLKAWGSSAAVRNACEALTDKQLNLGCIVGLGAWTMKVDMLKQSHGLDSICNYDEPEKKQACIRGAISRYSLSTEPDTNIPCEKLAPEYQSTCRQYLEETRATN